MQGLKISSFDRTNTESCSLISVEPPMPDRSLWCVQGLGGRTVSFGNTQCSCCLLWEGGSTCHTVPPEGAISGRCWQQINLFVEQLRLVDTLRLFLGRIPWSQVVKDCCGSEVCASLSFVLQRKAGISRRHVLGDAVVGGSHFVNRSSQRYFHNSCLYNCAPQNCSWYSDKTVLVTEPVIWIYNEGWLFSKTALPVCCISLAGLFWWLESTAAFLKKMQRRKAFFWQPGVLLSVSLAFFSQ